MPLHEIAGRRVSPGDHARARRRRVYEIAHSCYSFRGVTLAHGCTGCAGIERAARVREAHARARMTRAGTPAATTFGGISRVTTEPAPTTEPGPTSAITTAALPTHAPAPIRTSVRVFSCKRIAVER